MISERTQVGIVGAGPAGLLLSRLLALAGIDSVAVENRSRAYCEARQRAGLLEDHTVRLLRAAGLADRLDREGLEHGGSYLQFAGERHHLDFRDLVGPARCYFADTPAAPARARPVRRTRQGPDRVPMLLLDRVEIGRPEVGEFGQEVIVRLEPVGGDPAMGQPGKAGAERVIGQGAAVGVGGRLGAVGERQPPR